MFRQTKLYIMILSFITIVITLIIVLGILFASGFAPIKYLQGPKKIDINNVDIDKYEGDYVQVNIKPVFGSFLEEKTYGEYEDTTKSPGTLTTRYYIISYNEGYYLAVRVGGSQLIGMLEDRMNETWDNYGWDKLEDITIKGTISEMDSEEFYHFQKYLEDSAAIPADQVKNHILLVNKIGPCTPFIVFLCSTAIIILLLFVFILLIMGFSGRYLKEVKRFAKKNQISLDMIEADISGLTSADLRVGSKYIVYMKWGKLRTLKIYDYIWAYQSHTIHRENGLITDIVKQLELFDRNGASVLVPVKTEDGIRRILKNFTKTQPHMVIGYSDQLKSLYHNNIEEFMKIPYQQVNQDIGE